MYIFICLGVFALGIMDQNLKRMQSTKSKNIGAAPRGSRDAATNATTIKYRANLEATTVTSDTLNTQVISTKKVVYEPNPNADTEPLLNLAYTLHMFNSAENRTVQWPTAEKGQKFIMLNLGTGTVTMTGSFLDADNVGKQQISFPPGSSMEFVWTGSNYKSSFAGYSTS